MKNKIKNYSQWFPDWMNDVSDALTRDNNRIEDKLINIFRSSTPSQIPDHFEIVTLPSKISYLLISLLQRLPMMEQLLTNTRGQSSGVVKVLKLLQIIFNCRG